MSGHFSPRLLERLSVDSTGSTSSSGPAQRWRSRSFSLSSCRSPASIRSARSESQLLTSRSPKGGSGPSLFQKPARDGFLLQQRLRAWDMANGAKRARILATFNERCQGYSATQLEHEFFGSASLFFARVTSWFRLTYSHPKSCARSQLRALAAFLTATGGHKYVLEFIEVGGHLVLLDMLQSPTQAHAHAQVLRLLRCIVGSGPHFQNVIKKSPSIGVVINTMYRTISPSALEEGKRLLVEMGSVDQDMMDTILRHLTTDLVDDGPELRPCFVFAIRCLLDRPNAPLIEQFDPYLVILSSTNLEVQSEGQELILVLLKKHPSMLPRLVTSLVEMIAARQTTTPSARATPEHRRGSSGTSSRSTRVSNSTPVGAASTDTSYTMHVLDYTAAGATKLLSTLLNKYPEIKGDVIRAKTHLIVARNLACMTLQLVRTESGNLLRQLFVDSGIQTELTRLIGGDLISTILFEPDLIRRGFSKRVRQRLNAIPTE
ncbi:hypothetical protein PTSG_01819 [Salpingoeca rosetta]|uniref:Uncharacterized protein n=1 Tax=Salpingoeca rosetta (strain ATCC 50818 / BSB-021) TaxID=946362 RepID=F2TZ19_SALR5|nr:uncharacterized protein PTSG_01819 [Salpingoeca rosetta]EGD78843.1 hypothetical protein PTSG_01819 [Salpingoeca rosetta]|eukprot:XP_004997799.1 hypothetical protein PTSG_01819 [Salpingoeca rosetta]